MSAISGMKGLSGLSYRGFGGLGELIRAGGRGVSRYTGTLFTVFLAQSVVAAGCMAGVTVVLAQAFARLPMFDAAVDGDLVALVWIARHAPGALLAVGGVVFAALVVWQLMTWFLAGGVYGVLAQRPEGRAETARCFGASGAATYFAYARLAIVALPGYLLVLAVLATSLGAVGPRLERALTVTDLASTLAIVLAPTLLLLHVCWTITEYARVELTLRHDTHRPGALRTYLRTLMFVVRRPLTLVHGGLSWLSFAMVTLAYLGLASGHPMYGATGAVTLFLVRQGVALLRMTIRFGTLAGQVELGGTRPLPPRRTEPDDDADANA